jgi:peptidyl-prolyl cis-trans isomerase B (cyclophilin B)
VPTNEQRRATAKRKLERQLERRAEQDRKRRQYTIIGSVAAAIVVVVAVVVTVVLVSRGGDEPTASAPSSASSSESSTESSPLDLPKPGETPPLPKFVAPANLGGDCQYPKSSEPASKPVDAPRTGKVPTDPAEVSASMETNQGNIGLQLDNAKAPCTVNSFASLANKGFFDNTPCHRLTTGEGLAVLQCGDPTGKGTGGPGYEFANEYPTDQYQPDDPKLQQPVLYPRGTLAMANAGAGTNGSQFFLVYKDSTLPPNYTVFGTIDQTGLATLDKIAAEGTADGGPDGSPKQTVTIKKLQLD